MSPDLPDAVDTVVIGNGPSALVLSYILHGWIPHYRGQHHDNILHEKLKDSADLLHLAPDLYEHFASSLRYSTQALPIDILLDTLLRPNADTEIHPTPCVEWRFDSSKKVKHIVLGSSCRPGGQWEENGLAPNGSIQTLSYAEQLSLPGYSFNAFWKDTKNQALPDFVRPTRRDYADYLAAYPRAIGISQDIYCSQKAAGISRTSNGFYISSHKISCRHLVLASGVFNIPLGPPPLLDPVLSLDSPDLPLVIVGSGFTAADAIITANPQRRILHLFKWNPQHSNPLRGCHSQAYPEYAGIYRQMKLAAQRADTKSTNAKPPTKRKEKSSFLRNRDWTNVYEGLANAEVVWARPNGANATIGLRLDTGEVLERVVGGLQYAVGRRSTLNYLDESLRTEIFGEDVQNAVISARTLRPLAEADLEITPNVFITGSLTGDSLIRFAFGSCCYTAGRILDDVEFEALPSTKATTMADLPHSRAASGTVTPRTGITTPANDETSISSQSHEDLHLDRRMQAKKLQLHEAQDHFWRLSGWWTGGSLLTTRSHSD